MSHRIMFGGQILFAACVVGGMYPGGVNNPCATIHQDLIEAWRIDEGVGNTAAGVLGLAGAGMRLEGWSGGSPNPQWNDAINTDGGRRFFAGLGRVTLPDLNLLANVGDAITIAQRRWHCGMAFIENPTPLAFVPFGTAQLCYFRLHAAPGVPSPITPPMILAKPLLGEVLGGGRRRVEAGPLFVRSGTASPVDQPIPGTSCPAAPSDWAPSLLPKPYLIVITCVRISPTQLTFSVMGAAEGPTGTSVPIPVACITVDADGSSDPDPPDVPQPDPDIRPSFNDASPVSQMTSLADANLGGSLQLRTPTPVSSLVGGGGAGQGPPVVFAALTEVVFGGGPPSVAAPAGSASYESQHQAAIWKRAITREEVAWMGHSLDSLFSSAQDPGSLCASDACTETGGLLGDNPLIDETGANALRPSRITRLDQVGLLADYSAVLTQVRRTHDTVARRYRLEWDKDNGQDLERVRRALRKTRHGATTTRWRHPSDDAGIVGDGRDVCRCGRWRIVAGGEGSEGGGGGGGGGGLDITRGAGGVTGGFVIELEEQV
jgi:hypothetical protein